MHECCKTMEVPVRKSRGVVRVRRFRRRSARRWSIGATLLVFSAAVTAHDTWLLPERARARVGGVVVLDLTSGMEFPKNEVPVKPDRLERAFVRLGGKEVAIPDRSVDQKSLRLRVPLTQAGVATLSAESKPRTLELKPAEVREYLDEIGAWEAVGKQWATQGSGRWRETYIKHTKTFIRVGDPKGDVSWREPVGMVLELVPEKDPTTLEAGNELPIRVLRGGKPVSGLSVGLASAGDSKGSLRVTDSEGRVTFLLPRAGWWLLRATQLGKSSKPDADWESHFATMTVFATNPGTAPR